MGAHWKDWEPGECRLKLELVTPTGSCAKFYLPQVPNEFEKKIFDLVNEIILFRSSRSEGNQKRFRREELTGDKRTR